MALINKVLRVTVLVLVLACVVAHEKEAAKEEKKDEKKDEKAGAPAEGPAGAAGGGDLDITKNGAKGDGKADDTQALEDAWKTACGGKGKQTIVIPKGDYLTGPLNFTGPCTGDVTFQLDGNLLGSTDLTKYKANWIEIMRVDNLVISGKGKLDGQGPEVWGKNTCAKKYDCKILPNSLVLDFCNNATIEGITILNSKFFHMNIYECKGVTVKNVTVSAPGDSPNTDGIHIGDSSKISIIDTTIGVGDDCISIGPGSTGLTITGVTCGPGHGISVGSLGRYKDEKDVTDINVKDCTFKKTSNGLRIKSYEDSVSPLTASDIHYENIKMEDVANPIIIDQKYCPNKICTSKGGSKVTVKDVTYKGITGTSSSPEVVNMLCSDKLPCSGIKMDDVKVEFKGTGNKTMAVCENAKGTATGCLKELECF